MGADIKNFILNWSAATAARALMRRGTFTQNLSGGSAQILEDMMSCWTKEPICTSVVIIFWQMYLNRFAIAVNANLPPHQQIDPAAMIMRFMPLKSDGVLPGPL